MISFYNIVLLGGARLHGRISDTILSSLRVFINAHSRSIVSSVYDSLQHPYIILAKNGPTKTYLLYMYLSSLTEWSHSLAWFERPADNRKVLCSNHNGTTKAFRLWELHSRCAFVQLIRHHLLAQDPVAQKGVGRSFDIVLELSSAILSCLFFGAKIARIVSGKTTKTDPSEVSHFLTENRTLFGVRFSLPIKERHPCFETLFGRQTGVRFFVRLSQGGIPWSCAL